MTTNAKTKRPKTCQTVPNIVNLSCLILAARVPDVYEGVLLLSAHILDPALCLAVQADRAPFSQQLAE